jgi:amino acid transporter
MGETGPEGTRRAGAADGGGPRSAAEAFGLARSLTWVDGFSIALGVPVLMLFSVGSIVVLAGTLSPLIWLISITIGFLQAFVFAEMAGLVPHKSGGHSLYGSEAWRRRNRFIPPMNIWGNWFAWSPVLAISALLIGSYAQSQWFSGADWKVSFGPFSITLATVIGAAVLLAIFWMNHFSIKDSARVQQILGVISIIPLALLILVPIFQGKVHLDNLTPFAPPNGDWLSWGTFEVFAAGLFVAAWSAYAFETAICYTAEYRNPGRDAPRAILAAGVLNIVFYVLGPLVLLGVVGIDRISQDPAVAFAPLARDVFGAGSDIVIVLLIVSLVLIINTAILGSARTLFQASIEGYTLRGLQKVSKHKVPTRAMGFDVVVNLLLMLLGTPIAILAASTVGYMLTNVFDLVAARWLRRDTAGVDAPYRAPTPFVRLAVVFAGLNMVLLFVGGPTWGWGPMALGWGIVLLAIPFYLYRRHADARAATATGEPPPHLDTLQTQEQTA